MKLTHNFMVSAYVASSAQSYHGGGIKGKVAKVGIGYPCTVSVHERASRKLIESTETDMQGNYHFNNLSKSFHFFVVAIDPAAQYNAVIQDNVVPK